ncbi:MAG: hypothetical protein JOZ97_05595, partial [Candidatus Eremiobacteraeota bacterium]|nr:hypothetical protein [Candidatus Eremiobacteraeota bacterium]
MAPTASPLSRCTGRSRNSRQTAACYDKKYEEMANPLRMFLADLDAPLARDPAARGRLDVLLSYPGFHAI